MKEVQRWSEMAGTLTKLRKTLFFQRKDLGPAIRSAALPATHPERS
jgi:hypothetical protein